MGEGSATSAGKGNEAGKEKRTWWRQRNQEESEAEAMKRVTERKGIEGILHLSSLSPENVIQDSDSIAE